MAEKVQSPEPNLTDEQTKPVERVRRTRAEKALEARDKANAAYARAEKAFQTAVDNVAKVAKTYEAARQEAIYANGHPLVQGEDVVQIPLAHPFLPTALGFAVPTGVGSTQPAHETTLGSDGGVGKQTSNPLDPAYDEVDEDEVEDATVAGR